MTVEHKTKREVQEHWIIDEMIGMMEERRKWKRIHLEESCKKYTEHVQKK